VQEIIAARWRSIPISGCRTYLWSNGETSKSIDSLTAGIYSITVTDDTLATMVYSYTLFDPLPLGVVVASQNDLLCFGLTTGNIDVTLSGGTLPYSYQWSRDSLLYAASEDLANIPAGSYDLLATKHLFISKRGPGN